jgi:hypothetical protein
MAGLYESGLRREPGVQYLLADFPVDADPRSGTVAFLSPSVSRRQEIGRHQGASQHPWVGLWGARPWVPGPRTGGSLVVSFGQFVSEYP